MRTCKDKYGELASMVCTIGEKCDLYDNPCHCQAYREYHNKERMLKASDSKQTKF